MIEDSDTSVDQAEWLSLGKAAEMLGVHSMTLRRWSDGGRFPVTRTAGGHRRYALNDIETYLARQKEGPTPQPTDSWADLALVETRQQVAHREEHGWMKAIDEQDLRGEYRQMGHHLMGLLLQYLAADEPDGEFLSEARRIGRRYGAYGVRAGLSLTHILEATLFFRDILIESSLQVPTTTYVEPDASLRILRRVNRIINTIQLAVSEYYETSELRQHNSSSRVD